MRRDPSIIVVVADVADLWALERANAINARYHVLGGTLSPLDGIGPGDLTIDALIARAHDAAVSEIILALNATVDGQTTAHYITDLLRDANVKVTRLAHGVPVGGELDYLDEGTLAAAIRQRTSFLIIGTEARRFDEAVEMAPPLQPDAGSRLEWRQRVDHKNVAQPVHSAISRAGRNKCAPRRRAP